MAASQRIGGTLYFQRNGTQYPARGKFEYSPLTTSKTGVAGVDGVHGFTEKPVVPSLKGELSDLGGISIQNWQTMNGETLTCELANGKTIILHGAWFKGETSVNTEEGSYPVEFEGTDIDELVAS